MITYARRVLSVALRLGLLLADVATAAMFGLLLIGLVARWFWRRWNGETT